MAMFYEQFHQKYGVRNAGQLMAPRLFPLALLDLPQKSIYHYPGEDNLDSGPANDEFLFRHVTKPISMMHVVKLTASKGNPRPVATPIDVQIRNYHNKHRRYRLQRMLASAVRDNITPMVVNYAWLHRLYKYQRSAFTEYNRWWNIASTMWRHIGELTQETDRNHFIEVGLPRLLPGVTDLNIASECYQEGIELEQYTERLGLAMEALPMEVRPQVSRWQPHTEDLALEAMNTRTLRIFNTPESLLLLELWKWVGESREKSILDAIPADKLDRVNIVFTESGKFCVLNLGLLNQWRAATDEELAKDPANANQDGIAASMLQRRLLRMLISVFHARTAPDPEVTAEVQADATQQAEAKTAPEVEPAATAMTKAGEPAAVAKTEIPVEVASKPGTAADATINAPAQVVAAVATGVKPQLQKLKPENQPKPDPTLDTEIDKDLAELDRITQAHLNEIEKQEDEALTVFHAKSPEDAILAACDRLADQGMMSAAEYRRMSDLAVKYKDLTAPDGKTKLGEFITIAPETLKITESKAIPDIHTVLDKTMLQSSLHDFDSRYIKHVLPRDVAAMVTHLQHAEIAVTGYDVERVENVTGAYDIHTVKVVPVEGATSTLRFRLPALEDDGTYVANGVKYHLRKQKGDLPIRKISPESVALTSYYGKTFVSRSEKKVNDYGEWLRNNIMAMGLANEKTYVTSIHPLDVFDREFVCPRLYSSLAMGFREFTTKDFTFSLDHRQREAIFGADALKKWERDGARLLAYNGRKEWLLVDSHDRLHLIRNGATEPYPTIEELLGLAPDKAPIDFVEIKVMGRAIPVGFLLAYELGLTTLCKLLKVKPRIVPAGTRLQLTADEYPLIFEDESWVFNRQHKLATLILAGFNEYSRQLRGFGSHQFNKRDVYLNLLENDGPSSRWLREIDLMYQMFIDPITRDLLVEMKEPTDFRGLLLRAAEMLLDDQHPDELDPAWMRVKGYERMAGAVYRELVSAVRTHAGKPGKSRHPIELKPFAVWTAIQTDPAKGLVKDINPIQNLKEKEAMTFSGTGGRSSRSMTKPTRAYHRNDMGVTSESTVDSGDVGINTYTSADPQFNSLRGTAKPYVIGQSGATALLSTSALISPASDRDDPKRVNFVGIQQGHGIACKGYTSAALRTGYESVVAHRTSDLYATTAKQDGKVVSVSEDGLVVEYKDGSKKGISLGRRYGNAEGLTVPHEVTSELRAGESFKEGDVLAYNTGFFKRDMLNPRQVIWKAGILVRTVLMESTQTLEDSSSISRKVSELLTTNITKVKTITVKFDQAVHKLVKPGQAVKSEDILCIIEDALTQDKQLFDNNTLDTLKVLSAFSPQANFKGVVERVEVYYHGDLEDMSPSLRSIAEASDRDFAKRHKARGGKGFTGRVDDSFRVEANPLALDTLAIQVYITAEVPAGVGDKGVFANQMKTVFGQVLEAEWKTESGLEVDCVFGAKSIADRIVSSPYIIGSTTSLLAWVGEEAVKLYRGRK